MVNLKKLGGLPLRGSVLEGNGLFSNFRVTRRSLVPTNFPPRALNFEKIPLPITHILLGGLH